MSHPLREGLETLPPRIARLPVDERGYPVPWFVAWIEGKPEFRAMDRQKFRDAIKQKLCWVCGERLGVHVAFVAGPMCGINRTSAEPPSHLECAQWSARNCPFMNNPRMVRREDEAMDNQKLRDESSGFAITRNPGVAMVWVTRGYEVFRFPGDTGHLLQMGEPEHVEWYACGRVATKAEVQASIDTGLPNLEAAARAEKDGLAFLRAAIDRFQKYLPAE